jgi:choice-of-anchor B domain-containing protein
VTNPAAPEVLAFVPTQTFKSLWRDMKVFKNHVFIGAESLQHGLQVFDLTRLRGLTPTTPVTKLKPDAHYKDFGHSHNIVINEESGMLYVVGSNKCRGGLYIMDINSPKDPKFAGCFADDGYVCEEFVDSYCLCVDR